MRNEFKLSLKLLSLFFVLWALALTLSSTFSHGAAIVTNEIRDDVEEKITQIRTLDESLYTEDSWAQLIYHFDNLSLTFSEYNLVMHERVILEDLGNLFDLVNEGMFELSNFISLLYDFDLIYEVYDVDDDRFEEFVGYLSELLQEEELALEKKYYSIATLMIAALRNLEDAYLSLEFAELGESDESESEDEDDESNDEDVMICDEEYGCETVAPQYIGIASLNYTSSNLTGVTVQRNVSRWSGGPSLIFDDSITQHLGPWIPLVGTGWPRVPGSYNFFNPVGTPADNVILNLTSDIHLGVLDIFESTIDVRGPAIVGAGNYFTVVIRSAPGGPRRTISFGSLVNMRHFAVHNNMTLILENVVLDGGADPGSFLGSINDFFDVQTGGVVVAGQDIDFLGTFFPAAQDAPGRLVLGNGAEIRGSINSEGGAVHLECVGQGIFFSRLCVGEEMHTLDDLIPGFLGNLLDLERSGGQLIMLPGSVIENNRAEFGGGIYGGDLSGIDIRGGTIQNNRAESFLSLSSILNLGLFSGAQGGGIYIHTRSTLNMSDGLITNNSTSNFGVDAWFNAALTNPQYGFGGGVASIESDFYMSGGTISHNEAVTGGGVYLSGTGGFVIEDFFGGFSNFTMTGGYIEHNWVREHTGLTIRIHGLGGGVKVSNNSTFNMYGGEIRYNEARPSRGTQSRGDGGGVAIGTNDLDYGLTTTILNRPGYFYMHGGEIHNNTAQYGGGVMIQRAGIGGWLFGASSGRFHFNDGVIRDNHAHVDGGGLYGRWNSIVEIGTAGAIPIFERNSAGRNGGGMWQGHSSTLTVNNAIFRNNTALDGGGMHLMTFEYRPILSNNAYRLTGIPVTGTISLNPPNMYFYGNHAENGGWQPPSNAATNTINNLIGFGLPLLTDRMPLEFGSISWNQTDSNIWLLHGLNNSDINFRGTELIGRHPDDGGRPYLPPETNITIDVDDDEYVIVHYPHCIDPGDDDEFQCPDEEDDDFVPGYVVGSNPDLNITVTFPGGADPDDITVNLPGPDWSYRIVPGPNENSPTVVIIYPPRWNVVFAAQPGGTVVPDDVLMIVRRRRSISQLQLLGPESSSRITEQVPTPTPNPGFIFSHWTSDDATHRIIIGCLDDEEESGYPLDVMFYENGCLQHEYRLTFTTDEIHNFVIDQDTVFTAHFARIPLTVTFVADEGGEISLPNPGIIIGFGLTLNDVEDDIPEPIPDNGFVFVRWISSDENHRILVYECDEYDVGENEVACENIYRNWFTSEEKLQLVITQNTTFTAQFAPVGNSFTFTKTNDYLYLDLEQLVPGHANLQRLEGAHFELRRLEANGSWSSEFQEAISDQNGVVSFNIPLTPTGVYQLRETRSPNGFRLPHGYWIIQWQEFTLFGEEVEGFTFTAGGTISLVPAVRYALRYHDDIPTVYYYLGNFPVIELPATGGFGSVGLTLIGILSLSFTVLLYIRQKGDEKKTSPQS